MNIDDELSDDERLVLTEEFTRRMLKRFKGYIGLPIDVTRESIEAEAADELEKIKKDIDNGLYGDYKW